MAAIVNGMALHHGVIPYCGTFLIFSDYMRPAIRLSALMNVPSRFIFTHDSIGLGEDGPTHQPVEHVASLRAIPRMTVIRPADANETVAAWRITLERPGPVALILTRQKLPVLDPSNVDIYEGVARGAYVLADSKGALDLIIIATGSEVHIALEAAERLRSEKGIEARVVSMPSWELFAEQSSDYREAVLPRTVAARLAVEAGSPMGWRGWVGGTGDVIGIDQFGESAPGPVVMREYGFTVENVMERGAALVGT
jgi:transketolase